MRRYCKRSVMQQSQQQIDAIICRISILLHFLKKTWLFAVVVSASLVLQIIYKKVTFIKASLIGSSIKLGLAHEY